LETKYEIKATETNRIHFPQAEEST
jgi:hypothetical protein